MSRFNLREVSDERLRAELLARRRCLDCHTEHAAGWFAAGLHRSRCLPCHREHQRRTAPLLQVEPLRPWEVA